LTPSLGFVARERARDVALRALRLEPLPLRLALLLLVVRLALVRRELADDDRPLELRVDPEPPEPDLLLVFAAISSHPPGSSDVDPSRTVRLPALG